MQGLARLEAGNLAADAGDDEKALGIWRAAVLERPAGNPFVGALQMRIAQTLEARGDWLAAAEAFAKLAPETMRESLIRYVSAAGVRGDQTTRRRLVRSR